MDLIQTWRARAHLKESFQKFFAKRDYLPLDVPVLSVMPGYEVYLEYFKTSWYDLGAKPHTLGLRSSPEIFLKMALSEGLKKVYHIGPCFRNAGELGDFHHPEFTMAEWYHCGIGFDDFMNETEELLRTTLDDFKGAVSTSLRLPKKIARISVVEAFENYASIDLVDCDEDLAKKALAKGHQFVKEGDDFETVFFKIILLVIEPALKKLGAAFLYDYPPSQAALAKVEDGVAKRFEIYVGGVELCNAFEELLSAKDNEERLHESFAKRSQLGKDVFPVDQDFIVSLAKGIPPCCGNALGFDRWLALLTGEPNLDKVIPFRRRKPFR
jgi:lysyl-tRNA synthetase class 2